jgi:serine/threonine protein kinase
MISLLAFFVEGLCLASHRRPGPMSFLLLLAGYALTIDFNVVEHFGLLQDQVSWLHSVLVKEKVEIVFAGEVKPGQSRPRPIDFRDRLPAIHINHDDSSHDFGGLNIKSLPRHRHVADYSGRDGGGWSRTLRANDAEVYEEEKAAQMHLFESDLNEEAHWGYHDDIDPTKQSVKAPATYTMKPICNTFHEESWAHDHNTEIRYLGNGYYRNSYMLTHPGDPLKKDFVVKRQRFKRHINRGRLEKVRNEALAMELLTSSPRISNIYGHCAVSLSVEPAPGDIADTIVPYYKAFQNYRGVMPQATLDYHSRVHPLNNLTAAEKLDIALAMTESLADIHGLETGPLILGDVSLDQWLLTADGRIILNDLDNSVFLGWKIRQQKYSQYLSNYVGGFKAPEEVKGGKLDERADLWKTGDLLFSILTGLQPYYNELHEDESGAIDELLLKGEAPYIDPRYHDRSFIEGRLMEIMQKCFKRKPEDRPDIFEIVRFLRETKQIHSEREQGGHQLHKEEEHQEEQHQEEQHQEEQHQEELHHEELHQKEQRHHEEHHNSEESGEEKEGPQQRRLRFRP